MSAYVIIIATILGQPHVLYHRTTPQLCASVAAEKADKLLALPEVTHVSRACIVMRDPNNPERKA